MATTKATQKKSVKAKKGTKCYPIVAPSALIQRINDEILDDRRTSFRKS